MGAFHRRAAGVLASLAMVPALPAGAAPATMARVSVAMQGETAAHSGAASVSADGRFVAFSSVADNLIAADTNGFGDVFVRDLVAGTTERVSVPSGGGQADGPSEDPDVSADGRFVSFRSAASNLGAGQGIYVHDRATVTTEFVSKPPEDEEPLSGSGASMSADGLRIAFTGERLVEVDGGTRYESHVYVRDRASQSTTMVSVSSIGEAANSPAGDAAISADGSTVAFVSRSTNLAAGTTGGRIGHVYVRDLSIGLTEIVSISSSGARADDAAGDPSLSGDGRLVVFTSAASNLGSADLFLLASHQDDVYLRDRQTGQTKKLSRSPVPRIPASGYSTDPAISADGTTVVFVSTATNVAFGEIPQEQEWREYVDQQIYGTEPDHSRRHLYVMDVASEKIWRLSSVPDGAPSTGSAVIGEHHAVSPDGRWVAFSSTATDLMTGDTNAVLDVYLVDRGACDGGRERGPLSEVVDGSVERRAGPAAGTVDGLNCSLLVPMGL